MGIIDWFTTLGKAAAGAFFKSELNGPVQTLITIAGQGRCQEAVPLAQLAADLACSHVRPGRPEAVDGLNRRARLYEAKENYAASQRLHRQLVEIYRTARNRQEAEIQRIAGTEEHARSLRSGELAQRILASRVNYAGSLSNLAGVHRAMGDYATALPLLLEATELLRASDPDFATCLNNLAGLHYAMGDYASALPLLLEAREILLREEQEMFLARQVKFGASRVARCEAAFSRPPESDVIALKRTGYTYAEIAARTGTDERKVRRILETFRDALQSAEWNDADLATYLKALSTFDSVRGENHPGLGTASKTQAMEHVAMESHEGDDRPDYSNNLNNVEFSHQHIDVHSGALPLDHHTLETDRNISGQGHPIFAKSVSFQAMSHGTMETYEVDSLKDSETESVAISKRANNLHSLAVLHHALGDFNTALPLCRHALKLLLASVGEAHPDYATGLNSLAAIYQAMGDSAPALPLYRQALKIGRTALGKNHPRYAISLNNMAALYQEMGDYASALPLLREALQIRRTILGEAHPDYARTLSNLAVVYQKLGDHAEALRLHRQVLEICRAALGESHPRYAARLRNLAIVLAATGQAATAFPLFEQATRIDDRSIGQVLSIRSERQRIAFLSTLLGRFYQTLSLVLQYLGDSPAAVRSALDLVLRRKAIAAEAVAAQRDAVLGGKYPALKSQLRELASLRMQVARAALAGPGPGGLKAYTQWLADRSACKERLEGALAQQIPEMNIEQKLLASDRRAVALGLPEGVTLVEFVRFPIYDFRAVAVRGEPTWKPPHYVAFVLPAGGPNDVQMIDLGEAEPIDLMIADFRAGVIAEAETGDGRNMARRRDGALPSTETDAGLALRAAFLTGSLRPSGIKRDS
jgi:tetratricopeptide (TPR) repeat protein